MTFMHDYSCAMCDFTSIGWPSPEARDERGRQHEAEHKTGKPMPELVDFEKNLEA